VNYGCDTPAPSATAGGTGNVVVSVSAGNLVGPNGLALYTYDNDSAGASNCYTGCVDNWPPLAVATGQLATGGSGVTGTFTSFARTDGTTQVVYDGKPLYYFVGDQAPGDINGDGLGGVWHLARP